MLLKTSGNVTELLIVWSEVDSRALDKLAPLVFEELHRAGRICGALVDGRSFFTAVREGTTSFLVYRRNAESGARTLWKKLRPPDTVGVTMSSLTVTPDGRSYAYSFQQDLSDLFLITGLR